MSDEVRLICQRPREGFVWRWAGRKQQALPLNLSGMFDTKARYETPADHPKFGLPMFRVLAPKGAVARTAEFVPIDEDLHEQFMSLAAFARRSDDELERAIASIASRYGALRGGDPRNPETPDETALLWLSRSSEMTRATELRAKRQLKDRHYEAIGELIGRLYAYPSANSVHGGIRVAYVPTTLLGALWLQWARNTVRYQGRCAICAAPLLGRRGQKTCSDYCRKLLSLRKQK